MACVRTQSWWMVSLVPSVPGARRCSMHCRAAGEGGRVNVAVKVTVKSRVMQIMARVEGAAAVNALARNASQQKPRPLKQSLPPRGAKRSATMLADFYRAIWE